MRKLLLAWVIMCAGGVGDAVAASHCPSSGPGWGPFPVMQRAMAKLRAAEQVTIVCLGSSSTQGIGASSPSTTYPAQLSAILTGRFPAARIDVINAGVGGETIAANLGRLDRDVLARAPDIVVWQVATNDALLSVPERTIERGILEGLRRIADSGAQAALMDSQPLPSPAEERAVRAVLPVVHAAARLAGVPVLPRHRLMLDWMRQGELGAATIFATDRLHMTDISYRCLAERVADLLPLATSADADTVGVSNSQ